MAADHASTAATGETDSLLRTLSYAQQGLLSIVGAAVMATQRWPVYQYVEAKLDELGLDADEVFASLPSISEGQLTYSLARRDRGAPEAPVKLTLAGMAHLPTFASTVQMFLKTLAELRARRIAAEYEPTQVVDVVVAGPDLVQSLDLADEPLVDLLPELLGIEPATWDGAGGSDASGRWVHRPSAKLRRFDDISDVNDYVARLRAWIIPAPPPVAPILWSPLSMMAAFDYLDVSWQLHFGQPLVVLPSAERVARLVFDANTPEEFNSRLSGLGEILNDLQVPGDQPPGTLQRLQAFLAGKLSAEAMVRVRAATDTLKRITHIRNGGQHVGATTQSAAALPTMGLFFPISNHQLAWQTIQAHTAAALDAIRDEIRTAAPRPTAIPRRARRSRPTRASLRAPSGPSQLRS